MRRNISVKINISYFQLGSFCFSKCIFTIHFTDLKMFLIFFNFILFCMEILTFILNIKQQVKGEGKMFSTRSDELWCIISSLLMFPPHFCLRFLLLEAVSEPRTLITEKQRGKVSARSRTHSTTRVTGQATSG